MRSNYEYKKEAKRLVYDKKNKLALIFFIYSVIVSVASNIGTKYVTDSSTGITIPQSTGIGSIASLLIAGPFAISIALIIIKAFKKQEVEVKDLFEGFKDFTKALVLGLLISVFITLWSFLFIIPGIIMSLAYSLSFFIHIDHQELKPIECIKKSKEMMRGHKTQLFGLILSYFGHFILCLLTLGIYSYWLAPKMNMALYLFYRDVKKENNEYDNIIDAEYSEEDISKNI